MKLLLFGITKDIVGSQEIEYQLEKNIHNVGNLKEALKTKYPELSELNSLAVAVNEEYAQDDVVINQNDVVALIPPVSGG